MTYYSILLGVDGEILLGADGQVLLGVGVPPTQLFDMSWTTTKPYIPAVIPSYLYVQYNDDASLQAFVYAFNQLANYYAQWFANINLPVYTGPNISNGLLDWVIGGIYGISRPALPSGRQRIGGPYNTLLFNQASYDSRKLYGKISYSLATDDIYKRITTWNFYKGDGRVFSIRWLKRRVARFLYGVNGAAPNIDYTPNISITFGVGNQININILGGSAKASGGALFGETRFSNLRYGQMQLTHIRYSVPAAAQALIAAFQVGAIQLPFQYTWTINIVR